jgi:hypothetical protein
MWDKGGGEIFVAFGDTFGENWDGDGAGGGDWRSNVLAKSSDTDLSDGLTFSTMIQDTTGHAKEILWSKKINNDEITVIPTAGITIGSRHYIHYMSVNNWGSAGVWQTNYAGIAYSDDNGQNWIKHGTAKWQNNSTWTNKFQQAAFIKNGGFVYMYGQENGRRGDIYLARVPQNSMLTIGAYRYWDGNGWSTAQADARPAAIGISGELSVAYNSHLKKFVMMYLNEHRWIIAMREVPTPVGPWSGEKIVTTAAEFPGLYGNFIHPWTNTGNDLYFVMSRWGPYNSFLMKSTLSADSTGTNLLSAPGFEDQADTQVKVPWFFQGNGDVDRNIGSARTGENNGYVQNTTGWNVIKQKVVVQPYTDYTLKGWVKTSSNHNNGYFGARGQDNGTIMGETHISTSLPNYTEHTVNFNSGAYSFVEVYSGMWADGDTWMKLDDVSLTRSTNLAGHAGFEQNTTSTLVSPWYFNTGSQGDVDVNKGFAHTGANNGFVRNSSGWNAIKQEIFVEPNTDYTLSAYLRTSSNSNNGYFGVRQLYNGPMINEIHISTSLPGYTKKTVTFNSGNNHSVEIFAGIWANGDTWMQMDTFSVTKN